MRTKPILKLIKSVSFHLKNHDSFKIENDIRDVIKVTQHFKMVATKMAKYPDMDVNKKVVNYTDDLQNLMKDYPDYPEFKASDRNQFIHDLLTIYYFIYFDLQNKCQVKIIYSTVKAAKFSIFKKKWRATENELKKNGNVVLDSHFVADDNFRQSQNGALIIDYLPQSKIKAVINNP